MPVLADTHVHIYDCYDLERFFRTAFENFRGLEIRGSSSGIHSSEPIGAGNRYLFLTERSDCNAFDALSAGKHSLGKLSSGKGASGKRTSGNGASGQETSGFHSALTCPSVLEVTRVRESGAEGLRVVAGRQLATAERLEVLALNTTAKFPDKLPLRDALRAVVDAGGFPVLNWSLGKWMFKRRAVIESALPFLQSGVGAVGDVPMRPIGWGLPALLEEAVKNGVTLLAGSDPLPFAGEECGVARYVTSIENLPAENSVEDLIDIFRRAPKRCSIEGRRDLPWTVSSNFLRNEMVRRTPSARQEAAQK